MDAQSIIAKLGLRPHTEGGFFAETYRSRDMISASSLPARYTRDKALATAIYYLITPETFSAIHRLASDEVFHFYAGDAVEMLNLFPDGSHRIISIGGDIECGQIPQVVVPRGVWQGCRLIPGGRFALLGTTMAPGFDYDDYEPGDPDELIRRYPGCADLIRPLIPCPPP